MESFTNIQQDIYMRIEKSRRNYRKSPKDRLTEDYVQTRLDMLEKYWSDFNKHHSEMIKTYSAKDISDSVYGKQDLYDIVEELYVDYRCELLKMITTFNRANSRGNVQLTETAKPSLHLKLPKIMIPVFSGKYTEWTTFRDLYLSMIHNNKDLDNVQKLHYLKGYITGEAEQLLRNIPISGSNYERSWSLLTARYDNKKYISHTIIKRMLSQRSASSETAVALKELIDTTSDCLEALAAINIDISTWDILVIHIIALKLDPETRKQWEFHITSNVSSDSLPTYQQFKDFITNRYRALEFLDLKKPQVPLQHISGIRPKSFVASAQMKCSNCSDNHKLGFCKQFAKLDVESRRRFVRDKGLCFICLGGNHSAKNCLGNFNCRVCKGKHHSLLHPRDKIVTDLNNISSNVAHEETGSENENIYEYNNNNNIQSANEGEGSMNDEINETIVTCLATNKVYREVLLTTALINARSKNGQRYLIRALLDQGSQASFITEAMVQYLGLKKTNIKHKISGLASDNNIVSNATVTLEIQSKIDANYKILVNAYVLKSVTSILPSKQLPELCWINLKEINLADPNYFVPNKIDILLGADIYSKIIMEGIKKDTNGHTVIQQTKLGWIVSGIVETNTVRSHITVLHSCINEENDLLKRFWEIEEETGIMQKKRLTEEEIRCEEIYENTTTRDAEGRYIVKLPLKVSKPQVTNSRMLSYKRLRNLESKLSKNLELKQRYKEVMDEYISLNHMELVPENEINNPDAIYLPHHAIVREDKDTTKVRVVLDASQKGLNGISLNDNLMVGPQLQNDLRHITMKWRTYPIVLVADIIKMYRQVKVTKTDADLQRLLLHNAENDELKHFRLLRLTFGTASAPYLAVKTLYKIADDEGENYQLAAKRIKNDYFMDDLMTGCESVEEGFEIYQEINELLKKGGFQLQKWGSNNEELLIRIKENDRTKGCSERVKLKMDETRKILGLTWNRRDDVFQYTVMLMPLEEPLTKRKIISDISRLFDPLGWVAPCIILAKILIQRLWIQGIDWDQEVSTNILNEWLAYREQLPFLPNLRIPRWIGLNNSPTVVELHGFADASKLAYAAVIYMRIVTSENEVKVMLITAKTKVSPIKQISIPKLELCAAVLVTKLLVEVAENLSVPINCVRAWTDSTTVLAWLKSHPSRWKTFIANRVAEILNTLESHQWSYVRSADNPADCASRGMVPSALLEHTICWEGPEILKNRVLEINTHRQFETDLEQVKSWNFHCAANDMDISIFTKYSSLTRMVRVIAYCRRFLELRKPKNERLLPSYLTSKELQMALDVCIKQCQETHFPEEIKESQSANGKLSKQSKLKALSPFLDKDGMLRVGGRLQCSLWAEDRKHPIIIPGRSHLATLLIREAHFQTLHGGPQLMLRCLRDRYWIVGVSELVKAHVRKCVTCIRYSHHNRNNQLMGQLPTARATPARPFKHSGVDYAEPINIRTSKGRGYHSCKGYICLFVCMSTRAVHLEVVSDLTARGFLAAFRRFVARRGRCSDLWSDNGKNFVGASRELARLFSRESTGIVNEIAAELANNFTTWHFIPPYSPNFGGLWEAAIKSTKYHLKRIIGETTLTFEEMATLLTQVEACLNSRPLSRINDISKDDFILTPGHFLIGEALVSVPETNFETSNISSLRRWQLTQRMFQDFWRKWSDEYLMRFLQRYRWAYINPEPKEGDVVLVKEDGLPPTKWLYGRVFEKHPGPDSVTRVVSIKIKNSIIKRPTSKLCILPVEK